LENLVSHAVAHELLEHAPHHSGNHGGSLLTAPSIGWDWPDSGSRLKVPAPGLHADGFIDLDVVTEKKGVRLLLVPAVPGGEIMPSDKRRNLEKAVTPLAFQQKGFLDGDQHYLRNRFEKVRELKGKD